MKKHTSIYYDEEGDFLEIHTGKYTKGFFRDVGEGIAERIDEKTGKVTGIAILGFKQRMRKLKGMKIDLPMRINISQ